MQTKTKRKINFIAVHCSATKEGQEISVETIRKWHKQRGWSDIGYHFVIDLSGEIHAGRPIDRQGAHVKGFNKYSIGICYVGGLDANRRPKDTRTENQKNALHSLLTELKNHSAGAEILGHRDFSPDLNGNGIIEPSEFMKMCPCFDAKTEYKNL